MKCYSICSIKLYGIQGILGYKPLGKFGSKAFLPACSASRLPVLPFSTNAIIILFIFVIPSRLLVDYTTLMLNTKLQIKTETTIKYG